MEEIVNKFKKAHPHVVSSYEQDGIFRNYHDFEVYAYAEYRTVERYGINLNELQYQMEADENNEATIYCRKLCDRIFDALDDLVVPVG